MKDFKPEDLTEDQLRLCHNLYNKKWKSKHKDLTRAYNVEYYKRCKGIKKEVKAGSISVMSVFGNR